VLDFHAGVAWLWKLKIAVRFNRRLWKPLESTKTLEIAEQLLSVGNIKEAERLREKAREQRNVSVWLMRQVQGSETNPIGRPRNTTRDH